MPPIMRLRLAAAACTRRTGALCTLPSNSLAAYASANNVVLLHTETHAVLAILRAHGSPVYAVSLHASPLGPVLLLAASATGALTAWYGTAQPSVAWHHISTWQAETGQPVVATALLTLQGHCVAITAGMEGTLQLWAPTPAADTWNLAAEAAVKAEREVLLECIAARHITDSTAVVAAAGTDPRVWLFRAGLPDAHMLPTAVLHGHRDWVRGLSFSADLPAAAPDEPQLSPDFYLATASKDGTARVWRACRDTEGDAAADAFGAHTARVPARLADSDWSFTTVALLDEHTAAVHSVSFSDPLPGQPLRLVTSSMDCSVAVWRPARDARWECVARFGLMGGGSAHALGFFGASFSSRDGNEVLGHNFAGALHCWRAQPSPEFGAGSEDGGSMEFLACPAPGGHFAPVTGLAWEPRGRYLLTCSDDKTARIFAEIEDDAKISFVEWARPQVHGHALFAVAFCDEDGRRYVSAAEERMLRVFEAPSSFQPPGETETPGVLGSGARKATAAIVPELGLSNKATFDPGENAANVDDEDADEAGVPTLSDDFIVSSFGANRAKSIVPLEEDLKQKRLWPETAKLYGHGNEIVCVAADQRNGVLASACRAQAAKDAEIILWDTRTGLECGRLPCHDLTVNQMRFSADGSALVAVSRDRSFSVFRRTSTENRFALGLALHKKRAHTRTIYSCTWLLDDKFIATGSRDKCLRIFAAGSCDQSTDTSEVLKQKFDAGVSALDGVSFAGEQWRTIVAAGFENGDVRIFAVEAEAEDKVSLNPLFSTNAQSRCGNRINGLQWRPFGCVLENGVAKMQLGLASEDCSVRVLELALEIGSAR